MNFVIDGIRYFVETCGKGHPLLVLHGFTGDHSTWTPFYKQWAQHSTLYALDIVGHGKTDSPADVEDYQILRAAEDLHRFLEQNQIEKTDVLGYSMGGRLALTFAIQYPEKVRRLILESASPGLETAEERHERVQKDEQLALFIRNEGIEAFVEYWENIPLFASQKLLSTEKQRELRRQRLTNLPHGLANSLLGMGTGSQPSWWEQLGKLPNSTLLITGSIDKKFCMIAEQMRAKMKNAKWITVENCGHAIHVEKPEKFGTIVSEFLSNL
ncbi:2-succinyl-6-hydroxy-2,4-cyclohexadiene-1-carboxylate synthase [Cytobacillus sp. Hz8]|uniref:2-succinyl-6-hydroxy-2, 4-cyclohexadiene-1-carboxylate synthase n=1 Tax=Cytobacillus sp. Hz8 TaxID=3347168 RepID=UPI0035E3B11C